MSADGVPTCSTFGLAPGGPAGRRMLVKRCAAAPWCRLAGSSRSTILAIAGRSFPHALCHGAGWEPCTASPLPRLS